MSLDLINHKHTTVTTDAFGMMWWENPIINVVLNEHGDVHTNDFHQKKITGKCYSKHSSLKYNCTLETPRGNVYAQASFNALYARMVLGEKLETSRTLDLKNPKRGYKPDNVVFIKSGSKAWSKTFHESGTMTLQLEEVALPDPKQEIGLLYTHHKAVTSFTTEDGLVFTSLAEACNHQAIVSKGKSNAQVVLDHIKDYNLAEQIYFQEVKYVKTPYQNFIDVLNNNKGVVSYDEKERVVFDNLSSPVISTIVQIEGLSKLRNLETTLSQAKSIQAKVEQLLVKRQAYVAVLRELTNELKLGNTYESDA